MKKRKTPDLEKYLEGKKRRFVNYTQGANSVWNITRSFIRMALMNEAENLVQKLTMIWWTVW